MEQDADIHFMDPTFRSQAVSQRPVEIKLENSSHSFSLTESNRDKIMENIRESQIEDEVDIKTQNMKGLKRSAKQNELQKQKVFISPFQDTKINQKRLYIKQLKEQSTVRVLPSLRRIVNEINNVVLLITDRTESLDFFENKIEQIGLNYKIQDNLE